MNAQLSASVFNLATRTAGGIRPVALLLAVLLAVLLQVAFWPMLPPDMREALLPWYDHILEAGPIGAFGEPFSNYTPTYLYLLAAGSLLHPVIDPFTVVKLVSLVGTAFLYVGMVDLLRALSVQRAWLFGAVVFLMPSVAINSTFLVQCDAFWAGACLFAIASTLRGASLRALVWCGVAVAFKAQAAFIAPFIVGSLIGNRVPLWYWPIPALVYGLVMLPAWMAGWPAADLALVYVRQAGELVNAGNLANPWIWVRVFVPGGGVDYLAVGYVAGVSAAVLILYLTARTVGNKPAMLMLALLCALALPWLLPKMHERYFFLADVLAVAMALGLRTQAAIRIAVLVQAISLSALATFIYGPAGPALLGGVVAGYAILAICRELKHARRKSAGDDLGSGESSTFVGPELRHAAGGA